MTGSMTGSVTTGGASTTGSGGSTGAATCPLPSGFGA